jgi:hypothetical protein
VNYIRQLQAEGASAEREIGAIKDGLSELRRYLQSSKFHCGDRLDGYVNVGDVLAFLRNAEEAGIVARESEVQP